MSSKSTHSSTHSCSTAGMATLPPANQKISVVSAARPRLRAPRPPAHNQCSGGLGDRRAEETEVRNSQAAKVGLERRVTGWGKENRRTKK